MSEATVPPAQPFPPTGVGIVYLLTCLPNGKLYVGQTWCLRDRWYKHCHPTKKALRKSVIDAAIQKYGHAAFKIEILTTAATEAELDEAECMWIGRLGTLVPAGYNLKLGGRGGHHHPETKAKIATALQGHPVSPEARAKIGAASRGMRRGPPSESHRRHLSEAAVGRIPRRGWKHTQETRAAISAALRGRRGKPRSAETKAKIGAAFRGRHLSEEHRMKIGAAKRGRPRPLRGEPMSAETKAKIAAALRGRPSPLRGKPRSSETVEKVSVALRGRHHSQEARAKMSTAHRGLHHSAETRAKMSATRRGRHHSQETKAKISAALSAKWGARAQSGVPVENAPPADNDKPNEGA